MCVCVCVCVSVCVSVCVCGKRTVKVRGRRREEGVKNEGGGRVGNTTAI